MADMNSKMKSMGRNLAKAATQKGASKAPMKFAAGGAIPKVKDMGMMSGGPLDKAPVGAGKARGAGKATKGTRFSGSF
jgi:hypothetical protein